MKVLICDRFHSEALAKLKSLKNIQVSLGTREPEAKDLSECDILVIRSGTRVNEDLLKLSPNLKLVISCTSGFNHIDIDSCKNRNVIACYCPDANPTSAAELSFLLLLSAVRKFLPAQKLIQSGNWNRNLVVGSELSGKQIGIIGLGRIGSKIAQYANAFGMQVKAYDPYIENSLSYVEMTGFDEIIRCSDIISLHIPYTKKTHRIFKRVQFEEMQNHAILINSSRGEIISEDELLIALEEGEIAGAALDVFEKEPLKPDSRLIQHSKVVCSPHIGACTEEAYLKGSEIAYEKILAFSEGKKLDDTLPPKALWFQDL